MNAANIEVHVLGSIEAVVDGVTQPLRPMSRRLLAILAAASGSVVRAERLVEDMWPDGGPATAAKTLQTHVAHLRRSLGDLAIVYRSAGYVLDVEYVSVDAIRREEAMALAEKLAAGGDPNAAQHQLDQAIVLLRGNPFDEFVCEHFAAPEAARLEELACQVFEFRAELFMRSGHANSAIGDLERLVRQHPLRETGWSGLIRALQSSHRPSEARRAYERALTVLRTELDAEPGDDLFNALLAPTF